MIFGVLGCGLKNGLTALSSTVDVTHTFATRHRTPTMHLSMPYRYESTSLSLKSRATPQLMYNLLVDDDETGL
jgi:hypothetical protein